jgi:hypothetical protein
MYVRRQAAGHTLSSLYYRCNFRQMFTGMPCEGSDIDDVTLLVLDHARKEGLDRPEVRQRVHVERLHDFG